MKSTAEVLDDGILKMAVLVTLVCCACLAFLQIQAYMYKLGTKIDNQCNCQQCEEYDKEPNSGG